MTTMTKFLDLDALAELEPYSCPLNVMGTGYVLTEASADAAAKFNNLKMKSVRMDDGKVTNFEDGVADAEPLLVHLCIFHTDPADPTTFKKDRGTGKRVNVPLAEVRSWPDRVLKTLLKEIRRVSPTLGDDAETVETIDEKLKALTARRKELVEKGTAGKDSPSDTQQSTD